MIDRLGMRAHIAGIMMAGLASSLVHSTALAAEGTVPDAITLPEAIGIALAKNADLAAATAQTRGLQDRADASAARRWPAFGLTGMVTQHTDDMRLAAARANGEQGVFASGFIEGGVTLKVPLYTGGRLTAEIQGVDLFQQAAERHLAHGRRGLIFNVRSLFHTILAQQKLIASIEFSAGAMNEHLKRVNELVEAQKAARVDALRTEVRRAELEQRLIEARNTLALQERALATLLGIEAAPLPALHGQLELDEPLVCPDAAVCIDAALRQRADHRAARLATHASEAAVRAARGDRLPSVSLAGAYGYRRAVDPSDRPGGMDDAETVGRVGLLMEMPLFDGGRRNAGIREAEANLSAALERERGQRLRITREVESALLNLSAARQRVEVAETTVAHAEESLRIERERYDLGMGGIVDVLDAQAALLQNQTGYYRALADLNTAAAERDYAMGEEL